FALTTLADKCMQGMEDLAVYATLSGDTDGTRALCEWLDEMKLSVASFIVDSWKCICTIPNAQSQLLHAIRYLESDHAKLETLRRVVAHTSMKIVDSHIVCFWCMEYIKQARN